MTIYLLAWVGLAIFAAGFVLRRWREGGVLTLSYFFALSLLHIPGVLPYLDDALTERALDTLLGLKVTLIGLASLCIGMVVSRAVAHRGDMSWERRSVNIEWINNLGKKFLTLGIIVFLVTMPIAASIPSLTAIFSGWVGLLVTGIWLQMYVAITTRDKRRLAWTLLALPIMPLITLASGGFIGFGIQWVISSVAFLFVTARRRWPFIVLSPLIAFLGLSLFVTYMGERSAIRDAIWYEQADMGERFDRIAAIATNFQLLDLDDPLHEAALDGRLNQNYFVGLLAARHESGAVDLAYGGTIPWWILVPRAIWPEKPEIGGGGRLVADATGMEFGETTSVGAGQVLEFYLNFGWFGLIAGFFGLGILLMHLDRAIMRTLALGDMRGLLLHALPGLTLLQPGGNLIEVIVAFVGAIIAAHIILFIDRKLNMSAIPLWRPT